LGGTGNAECSTAASAALLEWQPALAAHLANRRFEGGQIGALQAALPILRDRRGP
jgi:hypothetical protein